MESRISRGFSSFFLLEQFLHWHRLSSTRPRYADAAST